MLKSLLLTGRAASRISPQFNPLLTRSPCFNFNSISTPIISSQVRYASFISCNNISNNPGAHKRSRRVGRGTGSGRGKTCGRGHKGKKARAGNHGLAGFAGGTPPLFKRLPKWGFKNAQFKIEYNALNLEKLQTFINQGRIDTSKPITMKELYESNIVGRFKRGVKLLAGGKEKFNSKIDIHISAASKEAIKIIEDAGGSVTTHWYTPMCLKAFIKPQKWIAKNLPVPRRSRPPPKKMPYYLSYANRGYLSPEIQLRQSQQHKPPEERSYFAPRPEIV